MSDKLLKAHGETHEEWSVARQELDMFAPDDVKERKRVKRLDTKWRAALKALVDDLVKTHPKLKKWLA